MLPVLEPQTAQETILKRVPTGEIPVPVSILEGIEKIFGESLTPHQAVAQILKSIRLNGDQALKDWSKRIDGFAPESFRVPQSDLQAALDELPEEGRSALHFMAARIAEYHRRQPVTSWITQDLGGSLGQLIRPIRRVGLYVPGGTAPLPSTVLMSAIPAKVAGVSEIAVITPPRREERSIAPIILAACAVAGVDEVYMAGGAQAIAALAYGTQSIPSVDKIFGPGNLFVTLAKQQVYGIVGIDGLAGPTETMIIADEQARPAWVAADMLAQAEHDVLASAILLTPSRKLGQAVQIEVAHQLETQPRAEIIAASIRNRGGIVITKDLFEAAELANLYAPEHLCLAVADPWRLSEKITSAGGVFLGEHSFEVLGDYVAGPSHVMPTGGSARFASPLNLLDFVHIVSLIALDPGTAAQISPIAGTIAHMEGLEAHAGAARMRME
jgi:histidinol dehydrogenase